MRKFLVILGMALATSGLPASYIKANEELLWKSFKNTHNKYYTAAEEPARRQIFIKNMLKAAELELSNPQAQFGASPFADLTAEEFKSRHNMPRVKRVSPPNMYTDEEVKAATPVDWRTKGVVTQVKNQGECGSCWSFSSTGGIEGMWAMAGNNLTSVSEQMLVSCDKTDSGCNGGLMDNAWSWLISAHSGQIVTEASYPYTSGDGVTGRCSWSSSMTVGSTIKGHSNLPSNEDQMATWVSTNGPLSIAVDASQHWQTYTGGVLSSCTCGGIDHGVLIVGFTADYWIVKNSWGTSWGESGYIRLAYGSNQCCITDLPCHPTV